MLGHSNIYVFEAGDYSSGNQNAVVHHIGKKWECFLGNQPKNMFEKGGNKQLCQLLKSQVK